ncbi:iron ABC transporter [Methanomicrobiaceae archaeon CYW5]|uniref:FecCD family ABC transporter permease n=1 Tax=Methanovulcanius yangii TaxID=1789227 RepID=UPI0029CA8644|nr:iron chelate uptake ABC transporter family permease subunit [Methanovulcanius yangii]MBT8508469.1 iron ABC transporter [Methanovulcanius yangii]
MLSGTGRRTGVVALVLVCAALLSLVLALSIGPTTIPVSSFLPSDVFGAVSALLSGGDAAPFFPDETAGLIVYSVRLPRVLAAFLVGAGLAAAGTAMQGLFRNSMADPYIIGTSSGAALGAAVAIVFLGGLFLPVFAFVGATAATFLVYALATRNGRAPVETLLLTGVALSMFFSAILSFLMYSAGKSLHQIIYWMMGGFWTVGWGDISLAVVIVAGGIILIAYAKDLNILSLGEEDAVHLGVNVESFKRILLFVSSFITGIAVAIAGSIGFIGLITPHVMRLIVGPDHRILFPTAMVAGGIFLLWADTVTRTFMGDMPVGVITAFVGAPFFIFLLRGRSRV